jgi:hypothetical protein
VIRERIRAALPVGCGLSGLLDRLHAWDCSECYGFVTLTITGSFALTCDPGGGSMLVTIQFDARSTIEYLGLDDDSSTLVRPSASSFDWAISAFSLVKSGIVICAAEAAADD